MGIMRIKLFTGTCWHNAIVAGLIEKCFQSLDVMRCCW